MNRPNSADGGAMHAATATQEQIAEALLYATGTRILIPTGRGSYIELGKKSLAQLLVSFDRAHPEHTVMTREEVIRAHERAKQFTGE